MKASKKKRKTLLITLLIAILIFASNFFISNKIEVKQTLIINQNIDDVWEIMGNQYAEVDIWSSNFFESEPGGDPEFDGLNFSNRITITERGKTIQELDAFDPIHHSFSYHITEGKPSIASEAKSTWTLSETESNRTEVN
ncbi:MAG: hypothetical protein JKY54_10785 [Flavobacteriales bacterium]|nr:hypothetical protein [Flavobacteriales bacterium]